MFSTKASFLENVFETTNMQFYLNFIVLNEIGKITYEKFNYQNTVVTTVMKFNKFHIILTFLWVLHVPNQKSKLITANTTISCNIIYVFLNMLVCF